MIIEQGHFGFLVFDSRLKSMIKNQKLKIACILYLLLAFSINVSPAEENQSDPESQEAEQSRKVSISAGPDGKVTWLLNKNLGFASGSAIVEYEDIVLKAERVWADMDKEVIEAQGDVSLEMKDQTIKAQHMVFDLKTKRGIMKDGLSFDDPWYNAGEEMSRLSEEDSFIEKGSMTSCSLDHPHYCFEASNIVIHLKKELLAKHVVLKVGGVPLLYFPVYRRSLEPDKPSRFIFKIGSNTFEGYFVKNILPVRWRMIDGSLFFNYTTRRGRNGGVQFEYDADKIRAREIFVPVPEDASGAEWSEARKKINELLQRAQGELDKIWLRQIFIKFQIQEADKLSAREKAEEALEESKKEDADFGELARSWSDDRDTKGRGGYLGFLSSFVIDETGISKKEGEKLTPVDPHLIPVIKTAFQLEPDQVSDLIETGRGYQIVKLESSGTEEVRVRHIFIKFEPSRKAQEDAQNKADEVLVKLSAGEMFEAMARAYSDDQETRDKGGDLGWATFQDLDLAFRSVVRILDKDEIGRPITTADGVYILKVVDKEKTPEFADLALEHSQAPSAQEGGDIGYRSKWELDPKVRRETFRSQIGSITRPIKSDDGYRIMKVDKKRRLGGDVYVRYGDLYSYQIDENPVKLGQTWDVNIHHNQTLWRGSEQQDDRTRQYRLRMEKSLGMRAELSMAGREFKQVYQSYTPERELRSYCALDYYWMSKTGSSGKLGLMVDGTRDLLGEDTGQLQKYPEISFRSPNYRLHELQPFRKINSGLQFISDRVQGKEDFVKLARQVSEDDDTKDNGGDLGWFRKGEGKMPPKVETDIFDPNKLSPGDVSQPISVTDGYHIVKIEKVEEKAGKRESVWARHIFISANPDVRTDDEASKMADVIYRKLVEGKRPSMGSLTLDNTSFSFDANVGNYFKDKYRDEDNIWLQTADISGSISKRAIVKLGVSRELNLDVSGDYSQFWHSKTQKLGSSMAYLSEQDSTLDPERRDTNVLINAWNASARLSIDLHRIYRTPSIPGVHAMRHDISPYVRFYYVPPGETEKRQEELEPSLYPFGAATWTYERKQLTMGMTNSIKIKTKRKREKLELFRWTLSGGADYTEEEDSDRRYEFIRNTFSLKPHKLVNIGTVLTIDPNNIGTDDPLLWSLNSDLRYSDSKRRWSAYLSRRYTNPHGSQSQQFFTAKVDLRWSKTWSLQYEIQYEYDERVKDIYLMRASLYRMLHCWESRIVFSRRGTKNGYVRKDFFVQLDIVADPGKALGVGYDDVTKSWNLRSLPGMGRVGTFLRPGSSYY